MPNLHKQSRNEQIIKLFDGGRGLTHRQIADKLGMTTSAVSMVISRWGRKYGEPGDDASSK